MLGEDLDALARGAGQQAEPCGSQPDLPRRFLARRVQDPAFPGRSATQAGGGLQEERGLADPGFAAEQDERAGDESPAQDAVELADAQAQPWEVGLRDLGQLGGFGHRVGVPEPPLRARWLANDGLDQAVPLTARAALAFPADEQFGAALADEAALRPRHA